MKKFIKLSLVLLSGTSLIAQGNDQIQNKNGVDIMPVQGEWALGAGLPMNVLTGFAGNMFGFTGNNNLGNSLYRNSAIGTSGISLFGKYMVSDNNAYRLSFYNEGYDELYRYDVTDDLSNSPDTMVVDTYRYNYSYSQVSAGYEYRRGTTRLRGIYGGEAFLGWSGGWSDHYTYGNTMGIGNMAPTTAWGSQAMRTVSNTSSSFLTIGARAFVGVEYFIAPKICLGTEFGWTARYERTGKSVLTQEFFQLDDTGLEGQVVTKTTTSSGGRDFRSGLDNASGQIYLTFYF
jgi:hypothetical protein